MYVEVSSIFLELSFLIFHAHFSFYLFVVIVHMLFRILAIFTLSKEFNIRGGTDLYNARKCFDHLKMNISDIYRVMSMKIQWGQVNFKYSIDII